MTECHTAFRVDSGTEPGHGQGIRLQSMKKEWLVSHEVTALFTVFMVIILLMEDVDIWELSSESTGTLNLSSQ